MFIEMYLVYEVAHYLIEISSILCTCVHKIKNDTIVQIGAQEIICNTDHIIEPNQPIAKKDEKCTETQHLNEINKRRKMIT